MAMRDFPTILPLQVTEADVEVTSEHFERLLRADQTSKAAITANSSTTIGAASLLETSADWLEHAARTMRCRIGLLAAIEARNANLKTPVAGLPAELLHIIFQHDAEKHRLRRGKIVIRKSWMRLGMVCHWWRRVLFNIPSIWANDLFSFGYEEGLRLLPLAEGAPLNVDLRWGDEIPEDHGSISSATAGLSCALRSARRIRYEPSVEEDACKLLDLICSKPLPCLEVLTFDCSYCDMESFLPNANLARHPKLRILTLTNICARPPTNNVLRSLSINLRAWGSGQKPDLNMHLEFLSQCVFPDSLSLCGTLGRNPGMVSRSRWPERLALLRLRSLSLRQKDMRSTVLMDALGVPNMHKMSFRDYDMPLNWDRAQRAMSSILRAWTQPIRYEGNMSASSGSLNLTIELELRLGQSLLEQQPMFYDLLRRISQEAAVQLAAGGWKESAEFVTLEIRRHP